MRSSKHKTKLGVYGLLTARGFCVCKNRCMLLGHLFKSKTCHTILRESVSLERNRVRRFLSVLERHLKTSATSVGLCFVTFLQITNFHLQYITRVWCFSNVVFSSLNLNSEIRHRDSLRSFRSTILYCLFLGYCGLREI